MHSGVPMSDGDAHEDEPALRAAKAPLVPRTNFYGRSDEMHELSAALHGGWRLVTLSGPPGMGKTRLARRFVQENAAEGGQPGACFVELADVGSRDGLVAAVAAAHGVSLASEPREDSVAAVGRALRHLERAPGGSARPIVVLDNFEQLLEHVDVISAWLDQAPTMRFIVTSRARLGLAGERVVELGPLSVAAGVALFEERARAPLGRGLTDEERADVERLVRRVDGIPLAIELAAGRAAVLGIPDVLAGLANGIDVLHEAGGTTGTAGGRSGGRHHSARAAVAWSWDLLSHAEQRALVQASVFAGGFVLESAQAVIDLPASEVMDAVQALRERSLLWARSASRDGAVRFGLFEIVREHTRPLLDDGTFGARGDVEERHARALALRGACLAERVASDDAAAVRDEAFEALVAEAENLEAAFAAARDPLVLSSLALSLAALFRRRGARSVHEAVLRRGIEAARDADKKDVESDLLQARAALASAAGEIEVALACQERALIVAEQIGDKGRRTFALARRGWDRFELGDIDGGLADMRGAVDEARRERDAHGEAYARNRCGLALLSRGSASAAIDELSRAATLATQTRSRWLRQKTLLELAHAHRRLGAVEQAAQRLLELAALGSSLDATIDVATRLEHAALARLTGRPDDALRILDDAVARADLAGALRHRVLLRAEQAAALLDLHRAVETLPILDEGLALAARVQSGVYRSAVLLEIARARRSLRDPDGALAALDLLDVSLTSLTTSVPSAAVSPAEGETGGRDAILAGAALVERALLAAEAGDPRATDLIGRALRVLESVGGKPLILALCTSGLLEPACAQQRRGAAEALLSRFGDSEARGAAAALRGDAPKEPAIARRLVELRAGRCRREMVIGEDGRFYEVEGRRVSLQRQRNLRLILLALVEHAERAPGVGLSQAEVLDRGWPGEKMRPDSGATRVYTSIRRLRRGGLSSILLTRDDGYLIDPSVTIRRA